MSDENNGHPSPPSPSARRPSFSPGQSLSNIFSRSPSSNNGNQSNQNGTSAFPSAIASAAANAQSRRRMSITTLGLSGSPPGQTSPFGSANSRPASISSAGTTSASLDESVIEEGEAPNNTPTTPFARRMSFGARALRDVRQGNNGNNSNGRSSTSTSNSIDHSASSPINKGRGRGNEGFNWSENLRSRAERTSSISMGATQPTYANNSPTNQPNHHRAKTVAMAPTQEAPREAKAPDHFQERILKGDFYMD
ncbi:MAG: hypothetical protein M1837_006810 [Sclerophora amabilis]|nr:MAG: hypothetical protein M1837_006810 [Sclerophora amabilis]